MLVVFLPIFVADTSIIFRYDFVAPLNYLQNQLVSYLNINSIRNKISDIRKVFGKLQLNNFFLSETKIDESFPSAQFNIHDCMK